MHFPVLRNIKSAISFCQDFSENITYGHKKRLDRMIAGTGV